MKNNLIKQAAFIVGACVMLISCKKDPTNGAISGMEEGDASSMSTARVNLHGNYSAISYNANKGYLVFPDQQTFQATITSLSEEISSFQYDKGQTSYLLLLINNYDCNNNCADDDNDDDDDCEDFDETNNGTSNIKIRKTLIKKSPLSDDVLLAFINKGFPAGTIKKVLKKNCQFSETVETAYDNISLPNGVRTQINNKRLANIAYNNPVLAEFEKRFNNYTSLRKNTVKETTQFLRNGGVPGAPGDPDSKFNSADQILSTLLNEFGEVKVGNDVYISGEKVDIKVAGGSQAIVNYIRNNHDIPRNAVPLSEPTNGLPKAGNPAPVDPAITVEPNGLYNLNCGGIEINQGQQGTQRVAFGVKNDKNPDYKYYWDFGDGYVSYKQFPEHEYLDGQPSHNVTVTVYNSLGVNCNPNGSGATITQTNCNYTGALYATAGAGVYNVNFQAAVFGAPQPVTYQWDFGDQTGAFGNFNDEISHSYATSGTYTATVTTVDGTGCQASFTTAVTVVSNGGVTNVNNTIPGSANSAGCDPSDRDKEREYTADGSHRFKHKFKMKNFLGLTKTKLSASVTSSHLGLLGFWWTDAANKLVNMSGKVYHPDGNDACGNELEIFPNTPQTSQASAGITAEIDNELNPGSVKYRLKEKSMRSFGTCYGVNSIIEIFD